MPMRKSLLLWSAACLLLLFPDSSPLWAKSFKLLNLGVPQESPGFTASVGRDRLIAVPVNETEHGSADLNQDADALDHVLFFYNCAEGRLRNSGLALWDLRGRPSLMNSGRIVVFLVEEQRQGQTDLNADGDTGDVIVHVYDARTDQITNLGLAFDSSCGSLAAGGDVAAFGVGEEGTDLNGDGDGNDTVWHVYDARTGSTTNVGLPVVSCPKPRIVGDHFAFRVMESDHGMVDLNGDGDADDSVIHFYKISTSQVTNVGFSIYQFDLDEHRLTFGAVEETGDLNGDGDTNDAVGFVYELATGATINLGLASGGSPSVDQDLITLGVREQDQGMTDLNGDGDTDDLVLHIYNARTRTFTNLGLNGTSYALDFPRVAFNVREQNQGASDLNGDGDTLDSIAFLFDLSTARLLNLGVDASPFLHGSQIYLRVSESRNGAADLNGDGDATDLVWHAFDVASSSLINLGLAGEPRSTGNPRLAADDRRLAIAVSESMQGNRDLNGDGNSTGEILHIYDSETRSIENVGVPVSKDLGIDGEVAFFAVTEVNRDLNGDGDLADAVMHLALLDIGVAAGGVRNPSGQLVDVLFLNGSAGTGPRRIVHYDRSNPFELEMRRPPQAPASNVAPYVVYAWVGNPGGCSQILGHGIGRIALPIPLTGMSPQPDFIWNNAGRHSGLGVPTHPSFGAPEVFFRRQRLSSATTFFIQGLIFDPGSTAEVPASVTNGILAIPR